MHTQGESHGWRRSELDRSFRDAVTADRIELNKDAPARTRNASGRYRGYLSWSHLSKLVSANSQELGLNAYWTAEVIHKALREERGLPTNPRDRQIFLEAVQRTMNTCFDIAREELGRDVSTQRDYLSYLGGEPLSPSFHEFDFDPASIGFIQIVDWNGSRQLRKQNVGRSRQIRRRQTQDWVPENLLLQYLEEEETKDPGSACPTLVGFVRDTREAQGQQLILDVSESQYHRHVAIRNCIRDKRSLYDEIFGRISKADDEGGFASLVARSPDSNIVINVTVQSRDGSVLLIKRPIGARTWSNTYQVGPHETMNWPDAGESVETCFELAERALSEEIGIRQSRDYYGSIVFSWFGYYLREASAYFFAHVRTRLTQLEILERIEDAQSRWEIGNVDWLTPTNEQISPIIDTWRHGPWDFRSDASGRVWLPHAVLSLGQLHRVMRQGMLPSVDDVGSTSHSERPAEGW